MRKSFHKANTHFSHLTCIAVQTSESNLSSVAFCNEYTFFDETRVRVRTRIFCIFACHEFESRTLSLVELNRVTQFHFYCVFFMPISSFSNVCFSVKHFGGFCLSFVYLRFGCLSVKKSSFFGLIDKCLSYKYPSASQSLHILYISCNT